MFNKQHAEILSGFSADAYLKPYEFLKKHKGSMHFSRGSVEAFITFQEFSTIITFRGTKGTKDVVVDVNALPRQTVGGTVHSGFFNSVERICGPLNRALDKYHKVDKPIYVTGHSKGGAEAQLYASRISYRSKLAVYTFGAPRVSDSEYQEVYNSIVPNCYNVINDSDPIPRIPKWFKRLGTEVWLTEKGKVVMKPTWYQKVWWFLWDLSRFNDHSISEYMKRLEK